MRKNRFNSIAIISLLVITGLSGFITFEPEPAEALSLRAPIIIYGNENFTSANGVTSGNGTENDPYIIEGWDVNGTGQNGIEIKNTDAYFIIRNVRVYSAGSNIKILFHNVTNGQVKNSEIMNGSYGIFLSNSDRNSIIGNEINGNSIGIYQTNSNNNTIILNNLTGNFNNGIALTDSDFNIISGNNLTSNPGYGISIHNSDNNIISHNIVNNNSITGLFFDKSENTVIRNNSVVKNYGTGMILQYGTNNSIKYNNVSLSSNDGILMRYTTSSNITENEVMNNKFGIYLVGSSTIDVKENTVLSNTGAGIKIMSSWENQIDANYLNNNSNGIYLDNSYDIIVKKNSIFSSNLNSLEIRGDSIDNVIKQNNISSSEYGIINSNSNNNIIENNTVSNIVYGGITYDSSFYGLINSNRAFNCGNGIYVRESAYLEINSNRLLSNNNEGLLLFNSLENEVYFNEIRFNKYNGIRVASDINRITVDNIVSSNIITSNNQNGIQIRYSDRNDFIDNNIESNDLQGIEILDSSQNLVKGNDIDSNKLSGIRIYNSPSNEISSNTIELNNEAGIKLDSSKSAQADSNFNNIFDNVIKDNYQGIYFNVTRYNHIANNTLSNNGFHFTGEVQSQWDSHIIESTNMVNGKPVLFLSKNSGIEVSPGWGQVILASSQNIKISNQSISNGTCGISLGYSSYNTISNNDLENNKMHGLYIFKSSENLIENNNLNSNGKSGIFFFNTVKSIINNNQIRSNVYTGIDLDERSFENTITENQLIQNHGGVVIHSNGNALYHNNFQNVVYNAYNGANNYWDYGYPIGGNYWSDLSDKGIKDENNGPGQNKPGGDGIGDKKYSVEGIVTAFDRYPLMNPFSQGGLPGTPENIKIEGGKDFIDLFWTPPASSGDGEIVNYRIYKRWGSYSYILYSDVGLDLTFRDKSVIGGENYFYQISALNLIGEGLLSSEVSAFVGTVPSKPLNLTTYIYKDVTIELSWNAPEDDGNSAVTNYNIYKSELSGIFIKSITVGNDPFYVDTNVVKGITYYYSISAINKLGEGERSEQAEAVIVREPGVPLNIKAVAGSGFINLSWSEPSIDGGLPVLYYNIYRESSSLVFESHATVESHIKFFEDSDLTNDIVYSYKISAENYYGEGQLSEIVSAMPTKGKNHHPVASIIIEQTTGPPPFKAVFIGQGFDPDGDELSYKWYFGDGNTSYQKNPEHTYMDTGKYFVTLKIIDDSGASAKAMVTIIVTEDPDNGHGQPDGASGSSDKGASPQLKAAIVGLTLGIVLIVILLFMWIRLSKKKPKDVIKKRTPRELTIKRRFKVLKSLNMPEQLEPDKEETVFEEPLEDDAVETTEESDEGIEWD